MNPNGADKYRQWDAAYVLGSLVPSERQEFEEHLSGCAGCSAAVDELAGMSGLLAVLAPEEAEALERAGSTNTPPQLLTGLAEKLRRRRQRTHLAIAGLVLGASAATVGLTVAVTTPATPTVQAPAVAATRLTFEAAGASPLTATGSITEQPWGTRIDWQCSYGPSPEAYPSPSVTNDPGAVEYSLVVVDTRGATTQVASWTAGPGMVVAPTATTGIKAADISRIEIRSVANTRTLLGARL
ncbi:zf-HC2 domain-containing protein [Arthrobacter sp. UYEF20]|uniref:anti-sigma factor family protein n=1 Tax=Arthrobacter sp. UYEF20 TaxID=1756363 RepID=UPI0033920906